MAGIDSVVKLLEPIKRRIALLIGRGIVSLTDDSKGVQRLQMTLLAGETRDKVERLQDYGFTSRPLSGSEAVVLFPNGSREYGLVIAVEDRRYRMKSLEEGEVAIYTDEGDAIHLKRGGTIEITAAAKVVVKTAAVELGDGALEKVVNGETFQAYFNGHKHTGNLGAPTSGPIIPMDSSHLSAVVKAAK